MSKDLRDETRAGGVLEGGVGAHAGSVGAANELLLNQVLQLQP